jgi:NIMA (never in mitosis gene a)-related kinase
MNIFLFKDGRVKIGDFGVAKVLFLNNLANTFIGTPFYLSPEICEEKPYNEKTDIWSLGCILYELLTLKKAFDSSSQAGLILKIVKGKCDPMPNWVETKYKKELINLVNLMLVKNPNLRLSTQEIFKFLQKIKTSELKKEEIRPNTAFRRLPTPKKPEISNISNRVRINPKDKTNQLVYK